MDYHTGFSLTLPDFGFDLPRTSGSTRYQTQEAENYIRHWKPIIQQNNMVDEREAAEMARRFWSLEPEETKMQWMQNESESLTNPFELPVF